MTQKQNGFTLIELLISLALFSILSTLVAAALHHSLLSYKRIKNGSEQLTKLAVAEQLIRRDIAAIQPRPVTTINGKKLQAILEPDKPGIEITTATRDNPGGLLNRSTLQRIRYELIGNQLIRTSWAHLDGNREDKGTQEVLLKDVENLDIYYVDKKGNKKNNWKMSTRFGDTHLPSGISIKINFINQQSFQGFFALVFQKQGATY